MNLCEAANRGCVADLPSCQACDQERYGFFDLPGWLALGFAFGTVCGKLDAEGLRPAPQHVGESTSWLVGEALS